MFSSSVFSHQTETNAVSKCSEMSTTTCGVLFNVYMQILRLLVFFYSVRDIIIRMLIQNTYNQNNIKADGDHSHVNRVKNKLLVIIVTSKSKTCARLRGL